MPAEKVFISYSHDSEAHSQRVLDFANALRAKGVDAEIDRYEPWPERGWPHWCEEQLRPEVSRYVLVICTATYLARVRDQVPADEGRGVYWEGTILYNYIYNAKRNARFIPVLLDDEPAESIPVPLAGQTVFRIRAFAQSDTGFHNLYRKLKAKPQVTRPTLGPDDDLDADAPALAAPLPVLSNFTKPTAPAGRYDIARIFKYAPTQLIGREAETAVIADAWAKAAKGEPHPHVLTFVALGGEGKTSLVAAFANDLAARGWPACETAFAWSFYRQGSSEQAGASSDLFFAEALTFFGLGVIDRESGYEKGKRLARHLAERRALLILDGLEPLQYPPNSPLAGQLKDDALASLLTALATRNAGLCLITTRYRIDDLKGFAATVAQRDLGGLSEEAGAKLLTALGVNGAGADKRGLSHDVQGHPLTLEILGNYLKKAHGGDIARRDRVKLATASAAKGDHAMRAMAAYAQWLESAGAEGARTLAMLRLTGLFDRPANAGYLGALWAAPAIAGLTEPLVDLSEDERNFVLSDLEDARLLTVRRESGALVEIDAHPLLREYFAYSLRGSEAGKAAHRRLYEHLKATLDKDAPTLDDLQPLYQAVAHGCAAGFWQQALDEVYKARICRGADFYATQKLGAFGADLGAVAGFFEAPWRRVSPQLKEPDRAWLMNLAGFRLRALGRLEEAREPVRAGMDMSATQEDWRGAADDAGNICELELTLGEVGAAIQHGEAAVTHADNCGDAFTRENKRTTYADVRHQAGERLAAEALFVEAEAMQAERQPAYICLYSMRGFRYCDLKLGAVERAAWRRLGSTGDALTAPMQSDVEALVAECAAVVERATQTLTWAEKNAVSLLDIGLDHLTLARAALYRAVMRGAPPPGDHIKEAVDVIRRAGQQVLLPLPLLTRALHGAVGGDFCGAREDLDEAYEIAQRGPMRLHLADVHLHRARLFGLLRDRPAKYPWVSAKHDLAEARRLIERCGYGRRLPELEDAEATLRGG